MIGQRFGRLLVTEGIKETSGGSPVWICLCDCGKVKRVRSQELRTGDTKSCGCLAIEVRGHASRIACLTHGLSNTPIYDSWRGMMRRCTDSHHKDFKYYGGRGILVCEGWRDIRNFFCDMGHPAKGMTLERLDVNGNYEPGNCCWADRKTQMRNMRSNLTVTAFGVTKVFAEWAEDDRCVVKLNTAYMRVFRGWSLESALFTPTCHSKNWGRVNA